MKTSPEERLVRVVAPPVSLDGSLSVPEGATGIVLFAHGSGSSRHSPRNQYVARALHEGGIGTLLIDLLTAEEEREDNRTARLRFDIGLLATRVGSASEWLAENPSTAHLLIGYFGASTGRGSGPGSGGRTAGRRCRRGFPRRKARPGHAGTGASQSPNPADCRGPGFPRHRYESRGAYTPEG